MVVFTSQKKKSVKEALNRQMGWLNGSMGFCLKYDFSALLACLF